MYKPFPTKEWLIFIFGNVSSSYSSKILENLFCVFMLVKHIFRVSRVKLGNDQLSCTVISQTLQVPLTFVDLYGCGLLLVIFD